ncbi:hypothetical protein K4K50_011431 [Colletotrichum sp. SAR 10_71]|nr:hypothetical protein K4K50_011431 [Colletotrichum sp. SAR 10_71]
MKSFKLGELRILAVLFLLLLSPAGSRPLAILQLRYRDIRVLLKRDPEGGPHNILIHFTEAFTKTYLGEKDEKTFPIPETFERITYAMLGAWIKMIGQILGFEYSTIAHSLRYNAGNEFDENVNVSAALRNLVMGHANSDPFRKHYLGRHVRVDLWGILRGQKPQHAIVKQACSISHSISKRRPIDLTAAQVASISTHPLRRLKWPWFQGT